MDNDDFNNRIQFPTYGDPFIEYHDEKNYKNAMRFGLICFIISIAVIIINLIFVQ